METVAVLFLSVISSALGARTLIVLSRGGADIIYRSSIIMQVIGLASQMGFFACLAWSLFHSEWYWGLAAFLASIVISAVAVNQVTLVVLWRARLLLYAISICGSVYLWNHAGWRF
jgi:hypothetical protein